MKKNIQKKLPLALHTVKPLGTLDLSQAGGAGASYNYPGQCTVVCPTVYKQE